MAEGRLAAARCRMSRCPPACAASCQGWAREDTTFVVLCVCFNVDIVVVVVVVVVVHACFTAARCQMSRCPAALRCAPLSLLAGIHMYMHLSSLSLALSLSTYIHIYIYTHVCICIW